MGDWLRNLFAGRPLWMNAMMVFSGYMAFVYCPWDVLVKPAAVDEEVWFGIRFHGVAAKWLALPHWLVYAAGAYGFWRMRPWMWPWAAVYAGQVAFSMLVWPILYQGGLGGWVSGLVAGALFWIPTRALWNAREFFEGRSHSLRERYGDWALVTGASAGIGAAFARALARDGVSCVLVARREDRLRELAAELEKAHPVATRVVAVDLARPGGAEELVAAVEDLEIGLLVNNAGFGYAGRFDLQEPERLREMVELNCTAPVVLTSRLLPPMRSRGRGGVIFVGSVAGCQPLPLHALYSATKAFDNLLGEALWGELQGSGVDVCTLQPGSTESEFHGVAGELPHPGQPAEEVVETAFEALGRQPSVIPGWFNWVRAHAAMRLLPRSSLALAARRVVEGQTPPELR